MKKIISIIIFLIVVAAVSYFAYFKDNYSFMPNELSVDDLPLKTIDVDFIFDNEDIFSVRYEYKSESLFEITHNISQEQSWDFYFDDYEDMGILVNQIRDKKNGENQKYWQYFIDDVQPQVSVNNFSPDNGEHVTWKFIESEF